MLETEVFGASLAPQAPPAPEIQRLCGRVAAHMGVPEGHVAVEFVGLERIVQLNAEHLNAVGPTDVLSFPIDGVESGVVPRELGDIVICARHTVDIREAIVHGMLHLLGMDHERDDGEMLALQRKLLAEADG